MDPKQTLTDMNALMKAEMWPEAAECAGELIQWLEQGNVSPFPYSRTTAIAYLKSIVSRARVLKAADASWEQNKEVHRFLGAE